MPWGQSRKEAILRSRLRGAEEYIKRSGERIRVTCQQMMQRTIAKHYPKEGCAEGFILAGDARQLEIYLLDQVLRLTFKEIQHLRSNISPKELLEARATVDAKIKEMDIQVVGTLEEFFQNITNIRSDYLEAIEKDETVP